MHSAFSLTRRSDGFSYARRRFISRNVPSRCIFFFKTRNAELMSLSRTKTCIRAAPAVGDDPVSGVQLGAPTDAALRLRASGRSQIYSRDLAPVATLKLEAEPLAFMQIANTRALDRRDM